MIETLICDGVAHSLARFPCCVTSNFSIHSWVMKLLESGLKCVSIRRWFLTLLSLGPELWPCRNTKAHRSSSTLALFELARSLVDVVAVWLFIVVKSLSARKAVQLLGGGVVGRVVTDLLTIRDAGQHFLRSYFIS